MSTNRIQRIRRDSERGAASREFQRNEEQGKRKRANKNKENIDEGARAAEDASMFTSKDVPVSAKKTAQLRAPTGVKPAAQQPAAPSKAVPKPAAPKPGLVPAAAQAQRAAATPKAAAGAHKAGKTSTVISRKQPSSTKAAAVGADVGQGDAFEAPLPSGLAGAVQKGRKPRPVARDLEPKRQLLVSDACFAYRGFIAAFNPYPSQQAKRSLCTAAWQYALSEQKLPSDTAITPEEIKLIIMRTEQSRGNVKTVLSGVFARAFGFRIPVQRHATAIKNENIRQYEMLSVRDAYVYEKPEHRKGIYNNPVILEAIIAIWFATRNDEGPAFPDLFNPNGEGIKLETMALILAGLQCCLDEWKGGNFERIQFTERTYRPWYAHHLTRLQRFAKHDTLGAICKRIRRDMYKAAMLHAGALLPKVSTQIGITDDDLDAAAEYYKAGNDPSDTESESEEEKDEVVNVPVLRKKNKLFLDDYEDDEAAPTPPPEGAVGAPDYGAEDINLAADPDDAAEEFELAADPDAGLESDDDHGGGELDEGNFFDELDIEENFEHTRAEGEDEEYDSGEEQGGAEDEDEDEELQPPPPKRCRY